MVGAAGRVPIATELEEACEDSIYRIRHEIVPGDDGGRRIANALSTCLWNAVRGLSGALEAVDLRAQLQAEPAYSKIERPYLQVAGAALLAWLRSTASIHDLGSRQISELATGDGGGSAALPGRALLSTMFPVASPPALRLDQFAGASAATDALGQLAMIRTRREEDGAPFRHLLE